jgi:low affinity Fe/Cu permease
MHKWFHRFAGRVAELTGSWVAFVLAVLVILAWAITGPIFHFSETWQLVINTGTTIITFLMVFVIQHTQNINEKALHKKLDEVIKGIPAADNDLIGIEQEEES